MERLKGKIVQPVKLEELTQNINTYIYHYPERTNYLVEAIAEELDINPDKFLEDIESRRKWNKKQYFTGE